MDDYPSRPAALLIAGGRSGPSQKAKSTKPTVNVTARHGFLRLIFR
ncbi:hypothetical protein HB779_00280 (plasmid) [Phyllobacterium sp. 628]|nr:hypothetical protein [Phyllobacterium sp. 628]QND50461.1 hypothetical protein HB779_00280 [Phyllobacterium sp. 628]